MTHREILSALSGMLLAMFVAFLSSTVVSNALPTIITDLRGTQSQYTWVVTATLLASTASTPIWGKLADLFSKKLLIQLAIVVFIVGSMLAGLSQSVETLIAWRVLQGLGLGGLQALVQIAMAAMISPRERGRYSGLLGGVMARRDRRRPAARRPAGRHQLARLALVLLRRRPLRRRRAGAAAADAAPAGDQARGAHRLPGRRAPHRRRLRAADLGHPAGDTFAWASPETALFVGGGVLALVAFLVTETRAREPIVPLRLFRDRTMTLAIIASVAVGVAMFGASVFLGQYLQISRGYSPTAAGLLTIPMVGRAAALLDRVRAPDHPHRQVEGLPGGRRDPRRPRVRPARDHRPRDGHGAVRRLPVRARRRHRHDDAEPGAGGAEQRRRVGPGAASSAVAFFRSLGGAIGVSVLGAVLSSHVAD